MNMNTKSDTWKRGHVNGLNGYGKIIYPHENDNKEYMKGFWAGRRMLQRQQTVGDVEK